MGFLMIVDEVATGFGRTGTMFYCEQEDVCPDFMCLGKGLTGGYLPLAATLTTDEVFNAFLGEFGEMKHFYHGHTYTGNNLACAVALANLEVFEEEKTLEKLQPKIEYLSQRLKGVLGVGLCRRCQTAWLYGRYRTGKGQGKGNTLSLRRKDGL
jgi:adenosylmethionine-8-amino-7-oxononanoate aminotransferase